MGRKKQTSLFSGWSSFKGNSSPKKGRKGATGQHFFEAKFDAHKQGECLSGWRQPNLETLRPIGKTVKTELDRLDPNRSVNQKLNLRVP